MKDVGILGAFLAGLASFLSPCVLPLVPGYISFISGLSLEELSKGEKSSDVMRRAGLGSIFFVLGFSVLFTALGATASSVGQLLSEHLRLISKLAGALIIVFGLHTSGLMPIKWLYYEKRVSAAGVPPSLAGAFLMGLAFACGWTPCIGPILAAILALAATEKTVLRGVVLLLVYSAGLGIPFILTGFGVNAFLSFFARYKRYIRLGELAAGGLLVVIGLLVLSDRLTLLNSMMPQALHQFEK